MRLTVACLALLLPLTALAQTVEYSFTGTVEEVPGGPPNVWNAPGAQPATFTMTFDVNTLAAGNSLNYTFDAGTLQSISATLVATDLTLSLDGHEVLTSPSATFSFGGEPLGQSSYIGGFFGVSSNGTTVAGFSGVPDFTLGNNTQAALSGSSNPLLLILNGSTFSSDSGDFTFFNYGTSQLTVAVNGAGAATSVPEPGTPALLALGLGMLGPGPWRRRRVVARVGA
jgi:hypothetical protein